MTDTTQGQDAPYRLAGPEAMDQWRQGTPQPPQPGAPSLAPQSPLAAMGPPPAPTAGAPPQQSLNVPPMPPMPQLHGNKEPPPDAKEYQKDAMGWASAFAVLGAIAGRFTRQPGGAALGAFGAAVKGWQTGNLQAYETAAQKWEQENKQALDNNKIVLDQYKLVLENRKLNIDEQMQQVQVIAANYQDKVMYDAAAQKYYTLVAQKLDKEQAAQEKAREFTAKLLERKAEQDQKNEQNGAYWLSPEGQQRLATMSPTEQAGVKQLVDIYGQKNAKPQNAALSKFLEENPNATAQQIQHFQQAAHPPRSAAGMSLQQFKEENPNATSADIQEFQARQSEMNAAARTKGGREANLDIILRVTDSAIPAALAASEKVPRGNYVPINKIVQNGRVMKSDDATMQFGMANLQLAEGWAKAMNPTGVMREGDRDLALSFLSTATSKETYKALVEQLRTQIQRERAAIQSGKQLAVSAPGETPSASETTGAGWTDLGGGVRIREKP